MATKQKTKDNKKWNYRVIKRTTDAFESVPAEDYYSIEEVFYNEDGSPMMHTSDLGLTAPTLESLKELLERLTNAMKDGVVDEIVVED